MGGRVSNNLVGALNILTLLLSIPVLVAGVWLSHRGATDCERFLDRPLIALGLFLIVVSVAGIIGACCRVSWILWVYLLVMFLLILLLFCFTIFAFVVTNKGAGEALSGKGYKEYKLGDYSNWLQKRVNKNKNWNSIKSCLQDSKVCKSMVDDASLTNVHAFYHKSLSAIQSGCCKPSDSCNFTYVSPTNWTKMEKSTSTSPDCSVWDNNPNVLCYNCQSCKAGMLDKLKSDWKRVAVVNVVFLLCLIIVYTIGSCAFRNNREDNSWKGYP